MNALNPNDTILIGIGNSGRRDDGLGWAFLDRLAETNYSGRMIYRYQLQIEDAEMISHFKKVIFVDASEKSYPDGFIYTKLTPATTFTYTTHQLDPTVVYHLSQDLFDSKCECLFIGIQGSEWELKQGLSSFAHKNLDNAFNSLSKLFSK